MAMRLVSRRWLTDPCTAAAYAPGCVSFDLLVTGAPPDNRLAATKWARRRRRQNTPWETSSHTCTPLLFCRPHEV